MNTLTLTPEEQDEIRYGNPLQVEQVDHTRWGVVYLITFERDGQIWQYRTEDPATEYQDFEEEDVEAYPAEAYQVTRYRKVES